MTRRALALTTLVILSLAAAAPTVAPQATPSAAVLQLYVDGKALTPVAPTGDASKTMSLINTVLVPGVPGASVSYGPVSIGEYVMPVDTKFLSDGVVSMHVGAKSQGFIDKVNLNVQKNGATAGSSNSNFFVDTASATNPGVRNTPTATKIIKFSVGVGLAGTEWKAGDKLAISVTFFGAGAPGTDTDLLLYYGSTKHPSGLAVTVDNLGGAASTGTAASLFLADKVLDPTLPTATASKKRVSESKEPNSGQTMATMGSTGAFTWGTYKLEQDVVFDSDSVVTVWLTGDGTATVWRGIRAQLTIGTTVLTGDIGLVANAWQSASAAFPTNKYMIGLSTKGIAAPAGTVVKLDFLTWSSTGPAGGLAFLYGSTAHPAQVWTSFAGAAAPIAAPPALALSAPTTELTGEAGSSAPGQLSIKNLGGTAVNVTLNVTSELEVVFAQNPPHMVAGNNSTTVDFKMNLASASAGETHTMTLHALVEGVEVANLTYTVNVVAAGTAPTPDAGTSSPTASPTGNTTASPKTAAPTETPGPTTAAVLGGLLALALALRRRRA